MLNLYEKISPLDNKRITNYIKSYATIDNYIGNERYLKYWTENKKKLYRLLGGNLIVKVPFQYEQGKDDIERKLREVYFPKQGESFFDRFGHFVHRYLDDNQIGNDTITSIKNFDGYGVPSARKMLYQIYNWNSLMADKISCGFSFQSPFKKTRFCVSSGMKPLRAIQKLLVYLDAPEELKEEFEQIRLKQSQVYNDKYIKGTLCVSIHPLDFMTMSDNASNWSSCMNWTSKDDWGGCYHLGTVEMMNSNNVVCCYLEGDTSYNFGINDNCKGEDFEWNNKKWRQLFYITKDIICSGKSYPYYNEMLTKTVLGIIRELARKNLSWTYQFGIEQYKDMLYTGTLYRMDRQKDWAREHCSEKHNIIFDTKAMYNDMFNANTYAYWCVRNKVKHTIVVSVSGKTVCPCCGQEVRVKNDDYEYYEEGSYNGRYKDCGQVVCESCRRKAKKCGYCGVRRNDMRYFMVKDECFCEHCYTDRFKVCPDCGDVFCASTRTADYLINVHKPFTEDLKLCDGRDVYEKANDTMITTEYCTCNSCQKKIDIKKKVDVGVYFPRVYNIRAFDVSLEDEDIQKHLYLNLETPAIPLDTRFN